MENRRINYANLSYRKYWQSFWLQLILSVCQQQHLCSFIQTCYLNRRKKSLSYDWWQLWRICESDVEVGKNIMCCREGCSLGYMYANWFFFLLNSAKCTVHYKNCIWEPSVLLLSGFCHSRKLWLWQAHSTCQCRMAMLYATRLSRSDNKCCFCFSFQQNKPLQSYLSSTEFITLLWHRLYFR